VSVLVVGGAGYIGSHFAKCLSRNGQVPVVLDNLCSGNADAVKYGPLVIGDAGDVPLLRETFRAHRVDAVVHFASHIQVGESVTDPAKYYANNVAETLRLLDAMREASIGRFVFSSTAAVYGLPQSTPMAETHPQQPINPYGRSKLVIEQILEDYARAYGLRYASLRYFNAAGADPDGELGECHDPETHLIPLVLQAASSRRDAITIYGNDYATRDGTCERDYVHVTDLAEAHRAALDYLTDGGESGAFNLGTGTGCTVAEVIRAAERVSGRRIATRLAARRAGDPDRLIADPRKAQSAFAWKAPLSDLDTLLQHAWRWEQTLCDGRAAAGTPHGLATT
jgi:UDP-glucose 4-epimerase